MPKAARDTSTMARSASSVSVAVLCSRVLGLVREQVFAAMFGAGFAYDAFVVAFRIPNLLRDLFGEGALATAFVKVFTDYDTNRGREATQRLAAVVFTTVAVVVGILCLVGILGSRHLVELLAPDFAQVPGKVALTTLLTRVMFPFLLFVSLAAAVMGMLNSRGFFFIPALASSFFNLGSIVGGVGLALVVPRFGLHPIVGMAVGTLVGGAMQLGCQLPTLARTGFRYRPRLEWRHPGLVRVARLMLPAVVGLAATQINIFVNTYFAAACAQGSVSWLNYAFRLVQFPIGVFGVALATAAMPVFSRHVATGELAAMRASVASALVMVFCLAIPATVGLVMLARPIVALIFEHGAFTALDTARTAEALACYALGLTGYCGVKMLVPAFYALEETRLPVVASFFAVAANIAIILVTIDAYQHRAIALATASAMTASSLLLAVLLHRRLGGIPLCHLARGVAKVVLASGGMALWLYLLARFWAWPAAVVGRLLWVAVAVTSGGLLYGLLLHLTGLPELVEIRAAIKRRLARG